MTRTELAARLCRVLATAIDRGDTCDVGAVAERLYLIHDRHPMPRDRIVAMASAILDGNATMGELRAFASDLEAGILDERDAEAGAAARWWYRCAYGLAGT